MGHIQRNYHNFKLLSYLFLSVGLVFVLAACSTSETPTEASSQTLQITQTPSNPPPITTSTNIPASATLTTPHTLAGPSNTPRIVPTLNLEQSQLAENFIQGTKDCQLPCWHGIAPGVSPPSAVPGFLEQLGVTYNPANVKEDESGKSWYVVRYYPDYPDSTLRNVSIHWNNDLISTINLQTMNVWESFLEIHKVLEELGTPDKLELGFTFYNGGTPAYSILMVYTDKQIALSFEGDTYLSSDGVAQMCLFVTNVRAWIFTPGGEPYRHYPLFVEADYWGDMSRYEINQEEFLRLLESTNDASCINAPLNQDPIFP